MLTSADIKRQALALGFDLCGVAPVGDFPELGALPHWLRRGFAGTMTYLNRTARARQDVRRLLPSARSVVVVASNYNVDRRLSTEVADAREALIARYAWGDDYHAVMGRRLDGLLEWMRDGSGKGFEGQRFVDTGPVQERVYAQYAGIGWIGKNTCVISPQVGSWILLGAIVSNADLEPDVPALDQCGTCRLCLEACPTEAIVEPHTLDARRCISYLTIEFKGSIPESERSGIGSHVFGCDICQDVCPWNATAPHSSKAEWMPRAGLDRPTLLGLWRRTDADLAGLTAGTPLTRPGVAGLRRNIAVALGNSRDCSAASDVLPKALERRAASGSPSFEDPRVVDHAAWALSRLG